MVCISGVCRKVVYMLIVENQFKTFESWADIQYRHEIGSRLPLTSACDL